MELLSELSELAKLGVRDQFVAAGVKAVDHFVEVARACLPLSDDVLFQLVHVEQVVVVDLNEVVAVARLVDAAIARVVDLLELALPLDAIVCFLRAAAVVEVGKGQAVDLTELEMR